GDARRRLPGGGASAAAIIVPAVFDVVGVAGVPRAVDVLDRRIVLGALVDVVDHQRDRRAGGDVLAARLVGEHAGQDAHRVRLLALRGEARLPRPAAVEIGLDIGGGERNPRRTAIDHAADRDPVALAEGRDAEQMAEGVVRHAQYPAAVLVARAFPA